MFDPTIYENLKVVIEGAVYDLDLAGSLVVTHRADLIDLATMSRSYAIRYRLKDGRCLGELRLSAGFIDLAGEKLEWKNAVPGCGLELQFTVTLRNPEEACPRIQRTLESIWDSRPSIAQTLSIGYGQDDWRCRNDICVKFDRKIGEGQIGDIPELLDYTVRTLQALESFHAEE